MMCINFQKKKKRSLTVSFPPHNSSIENAFVFIREGNRREAIFTIPLIYAIFYTHLLIMMHFS